MLIEVRSSPDDTNNTANQLFQRFNETLILKPRSKIALVSALITTNAVGGFRIDGNNQNMTLKIGNAVQQLAPIPIGDYTLTALCTQIQTALRSAVLASGQIYKDLFYPDAEVSVAKTAGDIVQITFKFEPQGFTGRPPAFNDNSAVTSTNITLAQVTGGTTQVLMRSRQNSNNASVGTLSLEVASGFTALHPILPYAFGAGTNDHNGIFEINRLVHSPRQQHIGLDNSAGARKGRWLLPSANPYSKGGVVYRFDNYTPVGGVNHGYDWVVTFGANTFYLKATTDLDFGVNTTHKVIDPVAYDATWSVREENDSTLGATIYDGAGFIDPPADTLINRAGENLYDLQVNPNGHVRVQYNGVLLNTPNQSIIQDGDGLRWVVNALDNADAEFQVQHPIPQIYHAQAANPAWEEIQLAEGKSLPDYTENDELIPTFHTDGLVATGTIGNGNITDTLATTSFLASDMTLSNKVGNFRAGELVYQVGASTPAGGLGMKLMAVVGEGMSNVGAITSVLVMGNGNEGTGYANGMAFDIKGLKSGSTATITIGAVAQPIASINNAGATYTAGNEYDFEWVAGEAQPPQPFTQGGRHTRDGKVRVDTIGGGGVITGVTFLDGGNGFKINDGIGIKSNGGGDGDGNAILAIHQVCEDANQVVMSNSDSMSTHVVPFPPMTPQDDIALNTQELGQSLDLVPIEFDGSVGAGQSQPIISSSKAPVHNNPANENILVDLPSMPINSRNSGRQGNQTGGNTDNHIATIPYQTDLNLLDEEHKQHYEPFNMIYHSLDNEADLNLNSFSVRLTNYDGTLRTDLAHPTQLTFSIQPDYL